MIELNFMRPVRTISRPKACHKQSIRINQIKWQKQIFDFVGDFFVSPIDSANIGRSIDSDTKYFSGYGEYRRLDTSFLFIII